MASSLRRARLVAFSLASAALAATAPADDNYWTGGSSFWDFSGLWTLGAPGSGQRLFIGYDPYGFVGATTFRTGSVSVASLFSKNALNVSGGTLTLASTSETSTIDGALNVSGGSILGAANLAVAGLTTLTGGTMGGSGRTIANGGIGITGGTFALADTRILENKAAMGWSGGTVNVGANATVQNDAGGTFTANAAATWSGGLLTNAGTLVHTANLTQLQNVLLTNTGTIESSAGELRFVSPVGWYNQGTIRASGTGKVTLQNGSFDVTGVGLTTSGGGKIAFSGATLTGGLWAPWAIPATVAVGSISVASSILQVGYITNSDRLGFQGSNTLDGVQGDKGFRFVNGGVQTIVNGFTPGGAVVLDYGTQLKFTGDRTIGYGVVEQEAGTNPAAGIIAAPGSNVTLSPTATWTGTGGKINAGGSAFAFRNEAAMDATSVLVVDVAGGSLTNVGSIVGHAQSSDYAGGSVLAVGSGSFANSGTIRGDGGGVDLTGSAGTTFSNTGTIEAVNGGSVGIYKNAEAAGVTWSNGGLLRADGAGSRLFLGGTFNLASLGSFSVTNGASAVVYGGTLDNTGRTLSVGSPNAWGLQNGGRILGGSVAGSANLGFQNIYTASFLENVVLDGGLNIADGQVTLKGSTHLNGPTSITDSSGRLNFTSDVTVDHDITTSSFGKIGMTKNGGTMTVIPGVRLDGAFNVNGLYPTVTSFNLVNNGTLRNLNWVQGSVRNAGLYEQAVDRQVLYNYGGLSNSGTMRASGTGNFYIGGDGAVANTGTLAALQGGYFNFDGYNAGATPVNSGSIVVDPTSKISVTKNLTQTSTGTLTIGIGPTSTGLLAIGGNVSLDGTVAVSLAAGFAPTDGSLFTFLTYGGILTGSLASTDPRWSVVYGAGTLSLRANPVPEPGTLVVLGLGAMGLLRRRSRR